MNRPPQTKHFILPPSEFLGRKHDRYLADYNYARAYYGYMACMEFAQKHYKMILYSREADGIPWNKDMDEEDLGKYGIETASLRLAENSCYEKRKDWGEEARLVKAKVMAKRDTHMMIQQYARNSSLPYHPYL